MHTPGSNPRQVTNGQLFLSPPPFSLVSLLKKSQSVILQGELLQFSFVAECDGTVLNDILKGAIQLMVKESHTWQKKIVCEISDLSRI